MLESTATLTLNDDLISCGDPRKTGKWFEREPDYIRRLDLDRSHVSDLLDIARQWVERTDWPDDPDDTAWYAPIHAWRALAQLGALEVVDLMLEMIDPLDALNDDWYLEEFPDAFALVGPQAYDKAVAYLDEPSHGLYPRLCIAHAITKLAQRHPGLRDRAVMDLARWLADAGNDDIEFNGFLIGYLLDLQARESAETIERAFAAREVDLRIVGNWNTVRAELGVEGKGLVPPELADAKPEPWLSLPPDTSDAPDLPVPTPVTFDHPKPKTYKSRARAKQKAQRQARKRTRKKGRKR